jgi:hypothetical protein
MQYQIKDAQGNIYGPAPLEMIRQWIREGRITAMMLIAAVGSDAWQTASTLPELAGAFDGTAASGGSAGAAAASSATSSTSETVNVRPVAGGTGAGQTYAGADVDFGAGRAETNGLALTSMILGICSFVPGCCCCLWVPLSIGAIVTGTMAKTQLKNAPHQGGQGMAKAGIILGIVAIIVFVVLTIVELVFHFAAGGAPFFGPGGLRRGF